METVFFTHSPTFSHWAFPTLLFALALTLFTIPFFTARKGNEALILLPLFSLFLVVFGVLGVLRNEMISLQYDGTEIDLHYYRGNTVRIPAKEFVGLSHYQGPKNTEHFYILGRSQRFAVPYRRWLAEKMARYYSLQFQSVKGPNAGEWWLRPGYRPR